VGEVYADFERELHRLGGKYAAHPRRETIRLLLLALEREQLVATGYREDVIAECLAAMPIGDAARDVIRHALLWVWKDEEMHTIYVRGALLKLGSLRLRVSSTIQQLTGWIGGWASSVQHHVRWRDAPLSRLFAALFTAAGALVGKVPRPVARELPSARSGASAGSMSTPSEPPRSAGSGSATSPPSTRTRTRRSPSSSAFATTRSGTSACSRSSLPPSTSTTGCGRG